MASLAGDLQIGTRAPARAWTLALFALAAVASSAVLLLVARDPLFAGAFLAGMIAVGGLLAFLAPHRAAAEPAALQVVPDVALLRAALDAGEGGAAMALATAAGDLVAANAAFDRWFGAAATIAAIAPDDDLRRQLLALAAAALRDGTASTPPLSLADGPTHVEARLADPRGDHLVWRFVRVEDVGLAREAKRLISGEPGRRLGSAGIMAVMTDSDGVVRAANPVFAFRAMPGGEEGIEGSSLADFLAETDSGHFHFAHEEPAAKPLRILHVPLGDAADALSLFLLLDETELPTIEGEEGIHLLLEHLPLGLALADVDGRFTFLNDAFRRAAGLGPGQSVAWPGDLVVEEDKKAVADLVHRFARGRGATGDLAVRLKASPDEPVALTVAGARGLGSAAVLLSLKDNSEEARLKREIAQASKMQAVGQLAGGVAHDFNNILTAILGTCDLMLMRHLPGDADYDDIQQIRSNSSRAASLTRQLLAFSRQQTLRPQVLQLPDAVSEVSHLLNRLLGERVELVVKHGRNLGPVRADPGQLEQVIVNLAVNARDAIIATGGSGTLTLRTFAVTADESRRLGREEMPVGDYTALEVSDTGTGIAPEDMAKIFEPFFTTKEVGKGTGLGLSTVYGIVKQSGGFIYPDSQVGRGTTFTIYLPVHHGAPDVVPEPARPRSASSGELWGSGTILLVEDEPMVRAVAERALTRHGYQVLTADNGEAALEIVASGQPIDLMISDVVMPTMDGPTTVRLARKQRPDLPILFISGYAEEQLRRSIDIENVAFLAKPFSVQQLAATVRAALAGE